MRAEGHSLGELTADVRLYPQVLVNVKTRRGFDVNADPAVRAALQRTESSLEGRGRVLLRASGTEPVIRVMVEGEGREAITRLAESLADAIRRQASA
jgi:phosphoglucosamine mutase